MKKKVILVVATIILLLGLAVGCTSKQEEVKKEVKTAKATTTEKPMKNYKDIILDFGDGKLELITKYMIISWVNKTDDGYVLDKKKVKAYVQELAKKYDTMYTYHKFKTSYGNEITVSVGCYGWKTGIDKTTSKLIKAINKEKMTTIEPYYIQEAASRGENDFGDSYIEVNLTAQKVFVYKDGKKVLTSDVVSGKASGTGTQTPEGIYPITYKDINCVLSGADYNTPVSYWMPFVGNVGFHDATWRSSFGSNIYKNSGSHGCVNLPYGVAKKMYDYVEKGMAVIVYSMPGTESASVTSQSASEIAQCGIDAIERIGSLEEFNYTRYRRLYFAQWFYDEIGGARSYVSNYSKLQQYKDKYKEQTGKTLNIAPLKATGKMN